MDDPTVHQLRLLLTLAEELHFKRAAARLYLTQPALSQQISALEHRLGVQLFTRTSRRVELTAAGESLLPMARKVVTAMEHLRNAASRTKLGDGRLRIGVCENVAPLEATRAVLGAISSLYPCLGPEIRIYDFADPITALESGRIDAAFVYLPVPEGFHSQPLTTEPRMVCVASSDPLAARSSVSLADLAGHPVVSLASEMFQEGRDYWAAAPRPDGTPVHYTDHQVSRFETLLSVASFGGAIAFVPSAAARLYPRPDLRYLPVDDLPDCTLGMVWSAADRAKPHIAALEDICHQLRQQGVLQGDMQSLTRLLDMESAYC
ncbi:LysR family transcriptional regulator [Kitasatospora sp. NPDC017646]|uniref:LysR family transcriptional regulator n=1 Tax=Kitasatospora sp. NPDC017646 TaxID=3364024 RepID=UPI00379BE9A7